MELSFIAITEVGVSLFVLHNNNTAGISMLSSSAVLQALYIEGNVEGAGGIVANSSSLIVTNSTVIGNSAWYVPNIYIAKPNVLQDQQRYQLGKLELSAIKMERCYSIHRYFLQVR